MSERGVFAVDRGIWDHDVFQDSAPLSRREAWLWLLSEAAWRPHRRRLAGRVIEVGRGQVAASLRFIASKWRWSEPRVRRFLTLLKSEKMIGAQTDSGLSVITICKYDEYQRVSLPSDAPNNSTSDAGATHERRKVEDREDKESKKSNSEKLTNTRAVASATRPDARQVFDEEFWKVYPKREGANPKSPARKAFQTVVKSGHDPAAIIAGAKRYAASLAKSNQVGTRYVAQAVTWLHQARWEDYPEGVPEGTGPPKPPDPAMPSDEELRRKYEVTNAKSDTGGGSDHEGQLRPRGLGVCEEIGAGRIPGDLPRQPGMASLGAILPRVLRV